MYILRLTAPGPCCTFMDMTQSIMDTPATQRIPATRQTHELFVLVSRKRGQTLKVVADEAIRALARRYRIPLNGDGRRPSNATTAPEAATGAGGTRHQAPPAHPPDD